MRVGVKDEKRGIFVTSKKTVELLLHLVTSIDKTLSRSRNQ